MSFLTYPKEVTTNNDGKGGDRNRRRPFRRRDRDSSSHEKKEAQNNRPEKNRTPVLERPKWVPPKISADPLPSPNCPYCGKPIRDIAAAMADRDTGKAVHFDCIIARIEQEEHLEKGDSISYIGGGRFGVIHFNNTRGDSREPPFTAPADTRSAGGPGDPKKFTIKKVIEWENKDNRAQWRSAVSDRFSVT